MAKKIKHTSKSVQKPSRLAVHDNPKSPAGPTNGNSGK
jgi:hypothetical protein